MDAWGTVEALREILHTRPQWHPWNYATNAKVAIVGHSNGGQGTWYTAARYPDRVVVGWAFQMKQVYSSIAYELAYH